MVLSVQALSRKRPGERLLHQIVCLVGALREAHGEGPKLLAHFDQNLSVPPDHDEAIPFLVLGIQSVRCSSRKG
jgi:hypothetical protein